MKKFKTFMKNGRAHYYQLGESTFLVGASGVSDFIFFISLVDEIPPSK